VLISSISTTGASGPRIGAQLPWINSIVNAAGYPTNVLTPTGFPRYP
jgi:hypothetical protein